MASTSANVAAPPAQPPRYGLVAAAPTVEDEERWTGGFQFVPEQCAGGGRVSLAACGNTDVIDPDPNPAVAVGDPFVVWAGDECSTLGWQARDFQGRARRQLNAIVSFEIADELWGGDLAVADGLDNGALTDPTSDTVTNGPTDEVLALGCLEFGLGQQIRGQRGMIHMTTQLLSVLASRFAVFRDGNVWTTATGNVVVADAGYDGSGPGGSAAGASQWMYGTSMIQLRLGPIDVIPGTLAQAMNRGVNIIKYLAERPVGFQWDRCGHVAAEVDVGVCLVGGAS